MGKNSGRVVAVAFAVIGMVVAYHVGRIHALAEVRERLQAEATRFQFVR